MSAATTRSPRYPSMSLQDAIGMVGKVFKKEHRNPMPKEVAITHMGYGSVHGSSLTALSALKKFGLLEGRGEELRVSADAVCIIADAGLDDQSDRAAALWRCLLGFDLYQDLSKRFGKTPSDVNVVAYLTKSGFKQESARLAARTYLASLSFVETQAGAYNNMPPSDEGSDDTQEQSEMNIQANAQREKAMHPLPALVYEDRPTRQVGASIPVTKSCSMSIHATGDVTQEGIDKLISYLELIKDSFPSASSIQ